MRYVNNSEDEGAEAGEIILSLLRVLLEDASKKELEWLHKSHEVDQSEHLQPVVFKRFLENHQVWNSSYHIEDEVTGQVIHRDGLDLLQGSSSLYKIEDDLK